MVINLDCLERALRNLESWMERRSLDIEWEEASYKAQFIMTERDVGEEDGSPVNYYKVSDPSSILLLSKKGIAKCVETKQSKTTQTYGQWFLSLDGSWDG